MKKIRIIFTFFVFVFSIILSGFSDTQIQNTDFANQITVAQNTHNQNDCTSLQENDNKDCQNACDTGSCDCINHSCTGTISLFNLTDNYHILAFLTDNGFSSNITYKNNNMGYPIIHPPQVV